MNVLKPIAKQDYSHFKHNIQPAICERIKELCESIENDFDSFFPQSEID